MDLPPDKMKMLREFPAEKKWDIIRDRVRSMKMKINHLFIDGHSSRIKSLLNILQNIISMVYKHIFVEQISSKKPRLLFV